MEQAIAHLDNWDSVMGAEKLINVQISSLIWHMHKNSDMINLQALPNSAVFNIKICGNVDRGSLRQLQLCKK